jgi:hypothetical protein
VSGPLGYFDPLSLCPTNERDFKKFRESELKHGRLAMIAVLGVLIGKREREREVLRIKLKKGLEFSLSLGL